MKKVILTFGITGCGKSTWLADKSPVVETDDIRKFVYQDVSDTDHHEDVFKIAQREIVKMLETCDTVYFGSTMVETKYRVPFLQEIKDMCTEEIEFELIVFKSDAEISKQRIQKDLDDGIDRANSLDIVDEQFGFYEEALPLLDGENMYSNIQYIGF